MHDQPTSPAVHPTSFSSSFSFLFFCLLIFSILTSPCGFAVFEGTLHYGVAESRSMGCEVVMVGGVSRCYHFTVFFPIHPSKQQRPVFRHLARCLPQPLTTHSR